MVSCVQIYDRNSFHNYIIQEGRKEVVSLMNNPTTCVVDSSKIKNECVSMDSVCEVTITNNNYSYSHTNTNLHEDSVLDIISKSDGLLSSNGLTFCITLIVGLLAALLLFRIEKMEQLVEKNKDLLKENEELQGWTKSRYKVFNILTRIESAYNFSITIGGMSLTLLHTADPSAKIDISTSIGALCSRFSNICSQIEFRLNKTETRIDVLTKDEKNIIDMYLEDTIDALQRCLSNVNNCSIPDLSRIIENIIYSIEDIKDIINSIEVKRK